MTFVFAHGFLTVAYIFIHCEVLGVTACNVENQKVGYFLKFSSNNSFLSLLQNPQPTNLTPSPTDPTYLPTPT